MSTDRIALQLYSVRDLTAPDMLGALRHVAEIGFHGVEFAGFGNATVPEIRRMLDEVALKAVSAHVPMDRFATQLDETIAELQTLGCTNAVVPWAGEEWRDADGVAKLAAHFNEWGARCRDAGLRFGYHNHGFEFDVIAGSHGRPFRDHPKAALARLIESLPGT
jgi:sugar phosphate isomerase/epimerase